MAVDDPTVDLTTFSNDDYNTILVQMDCSWNNEQSIDTLSYDYSITRGLEVICNESINLDVSSIDSYSSILSMEGMPLQEGDIVNATVTVASGNDSATVNMNLAIEPPFTVGSLFGSVEQIETYPLEGETNQPYIPILIARLTLSNIDPNAINIDYTVNDSFQGQQAATITTIDYPTQSGQVVDFSVTQSVLFGSNLTTSDPSYFTWGIFFDPINPPTLPVIEIVSVDGDDGDHLNADLTFDFDNTNDNLHYIYNILRNEEELISVEATVDISGLDTLTIASIQPVGGLTIDDIVEVQAKVGKVYGTGTFTIWSADSELVYDLSTVINMSPPTIPTPTITIGTTNSFAQNDWVFPSTIYVGGTVRPNGVFSFNYDDSGTYPYSDFIIRINGSTYRTETDYRWPFDTDSATGHFEYVPTQGDNGTTLVDGDEVIITLAQGSKLKDTITYSESVQRTVNISTPYFNCPPDPVVQRFFELGNAGELVCTIKVIGTVDYDFTDSYNNTNYRDFLTIEFKVASLAISKYQEYGPLTSDQTIAFASFSRLQPSLGPVPFIDLQDQDVEVKVSQLRRYTTGSQTVLFSSNVITQNFSFPSFSTVDASIEQETTDVTNNCAKVVVIGASANVTKLKYTVQKNSTPVLSNQIVDFDNQTGLTLRYPDPADDSTLISGDTVTFLIYQGRITDNVLEYSTSATSVSITMVIE